jgi:hypothetical protein
MKFGASGLHGLSVDLRGRASVLYAAAFGRSLLETGKPANGAAILIGCDFGGRGRRRLRTVRTAPEAIIGDNIQMLCESESVYIPLGEVHRLDNLGKIPLELVEVQTGSYLGEDDIIRIVDELGRIQLNVIWLETRRRMIPTLRNGIQIFAALQ